MVFGIVRCLRYHAARDQVGVGHCLLRVQYRTEAAVGSILERGLFFAAICGDTGFMSRSHRHVIAGAAAGDVVAGDAAGWTIELAVHCVPRGSAPARMATNDDLAPELKGFKLRLVSKAGSM